MPDYFYARRFFVLFLLRNWLTRLFRNSLNESKELNLFYKDYFYKEGGEEYHGSLNQFSNLPYKLISAKDSFFHRLPIEDDALSFLYFKILHNIHLYVNLLKNTRIKICQFIKFVSQKFHRNISIFFNIARILFFDETRIFWLETFIYIYRTFERLHYNALSLELRWICNKLAS